MAEIREYLDEQGLRLLWQIIDKDFSYKLTAGDYIQITDPYNRTKVQVRSTIGDRSGIVVGNGDGSIDYIQFDVYDKDKVLRVKLDDYGSPRLVWDSVLLLPDMSGNQDTVLSIKKNGDELSPEWRNLSGYNKDTFGVNDSISGRQIVTALKIVLSSDGKLSSTDSTIFEIGKANLNITVGGNSIPDGTFNANAVSNKTIDIPTSKNDIFGVVKISDGLQYKQESGVTQYGVIQAKPNKAISVDSNGISVKYDDETLNINSENELAVIDPIPDRNPADKDKVLTVIDEYGNYTWSDLPEAVIDTTMSDTSTNAVQNRVIKRYVDDSIDALDTSVTLTRVNSTDNKDTVYIAETLLETNGIISAPTTKLIDIGKGNLNITYTDIRGDLQTKTFNANALSDISFEIPIGRLYTAEDSTVVITDIPNTLNSKIRVNTIDDVVNGSELPVTSNAVFDKISELDVDEITLLEKLSTGDSYAIYGIREVDGKIERGTTPSVIINDGILSIRDADGTIINNTFSANKSDNVDVTIPTATRNSLGLMKVSEDDPTASATPPRKYDTYIKNGQVFAFSREADESDMKADTAIQGVELNGVELPKDVNNKVNIPEATETVYGIDKKYSGKDPILIIDNEISIKYDDVTITNDTTNGLTARKASTNLGVVKMSEESGSSAYTTGKAIYIDADGTIKGNYLPGSGISIVENYITANAGISLKVTPNHLLEPSPDSKTIYLEDDGSGESYQQWVYYDDKWWYIGSTKLSLIEYDKIQDRIDAINALDGEAYVAIKDPINSRVTLKNRIVEENGYIRNAGPDIILSLVASTGKYTDLSEKLREGNGVNIGSDLSINITPGPAKSFLATNDTGTGVEWVEGAEEPVKNTLTLTKNGTLLSPTFTANDVDATIPLGDIVTDVLIQGTSICSIIGADRVANIPYASDLEYGVVKTGVGILCDTGIITPNWMENSEIDSFEW